MKIFLASAALALTALAACQEGKSTVSVETSPGGLTYIRFYLPKAEDVAIEIAWPSTWAFRENIHPAVPVGAELILAGGAVGYPPGEVVETFADLNAEGDLWTLPDFLHGELIVPKDNLDKAVEIAQAHLARPALDADWQERIRKGLAANMTEASVQPDVQGYEALRWAIFGDTAFRRALASDVPEKFAAVTRDDVQRWHAETVTRSGAYIAIGGDIDAKAAGHALDTLLSGLPDNSPPTAAAPKTDFSPRRILLHLPGAEASTLIFIGRLPPTREGRELEDILLISALGGGDDKSVLFNAIRTKLRASYSFDAFIDAFTRDLRVLVMSGVVETAKLAEAEALVRRVYADFQKAPDMGDLDARKAGVRANLEQNASDPAMMAFSALQAAMDGKDPSLVLGLPRELDEITEESLKARAALAFPPADQLIVIAVTPDAAALPGACVITAPAEALNCR